MTDPITRMNPPTLPDAGSIGYSQISVVEPGRLAFISGQVAVHADGSPAPDDLAGQAKLAAENVRKALEAAGAAPGDIVMETPVDCGRSSFKLEGEDQSSADIVEEFADDHEVWADAFIKGWQVLSVQVYIIVLDIL